MQCLEIIRGDHLEVGIGAQRRVRVGRQPRYRERRFGVHAIERQIAQRAYVGNSRYASDGGKNAAIIDRFFGSEIGSKNSVGTRGGRGGGGCLPGFASLVVCDRAEPRR